MGWQDTAGYHKSAMTRSFDISESGMRLELVERLPFRADVMLRCEKLGLQTRATVRYCRSHGLRYSVGVEFGGGYRWVPPNQDIRHAVEQAEVVLI